MRRSYNASSLTDRNRIQHWKYSKKKMVNGKWRYYYDDDDKPDKGFSFKKNDRNTMEINSSVYVPGSNTGVRLHNKSYYVNGEKVDKDTYEHAGARLYYKNEPVRDIAKRDIEKGKNFVDKSIKKGVKVTTSAINKAKKWFSKLFG